MEDSILRMENRQTDTVQRLGSVGQETESLKRKLNKRSVAVQNAKAQANNTAHTARNLNKVCTCEPSDHALRQLQTIAKSLTTYHTLKAV